MNLKQDTTFYAIWQRRTVVALDAGEDGYFENYVGSDENTGAPIFETSRYSAQYVITGTSYSASWIYQTPRRDGFVFEGWSVNGTDIAGEIDTSEDIVLTAIWAEEISVVFDCDGGHFEDGSIFKFMDCVEGDVVITRWMERPVREGYTFGGWAINGQIVRSFTASEATSLKAIWIPDNEA